MSLNSLSFKRVKNSLFALVAMMVLVALKLLLVSQSEIYLSSGDNLTYVFYADHNYWGTPFLPDRPPVTSLWMAFAHESGIRFRLLQEILYVSAVGAAAYALNKVGVPRLITVLFFALTLFAPIANYHLDFAMADGLYMSLQLWLISLLFLVLIASKTKETLSWSFLAGVAAATMIHTRMESEFIALILVCFAILFVCKEWRRKSNSAAMTFFVFAAISVPIAISTFAIVISNINVYGYSGLGNVLTNGEAAVMKQLMRIDGGHDGRYLPITARARALAFDASPSFRKWRGVIEDPFVIKLSEDYTGVVGGLDTQRYLPLLKRIGQTSAYPGLFGSTDSEDDVKSKVKSREAELDKIADELRQALDQGKVPARTAPFALIDPVAGTWLPLIPESLLKIGKLLFISPPPWVDMQGYGLMKRESDRMTKVLNRDPYLTSKGPLKGQMVVGPSKQIESVDLFVNALIFPMFAEFDKQPSQKISAATLVQLSDKEYEFEFPVLDERWVPVTLALHVRFTDGTVENISHLVTDAVVTLPPKYSTGVVCYQINKFAPVISSNQARAYAVQGSLSKAYPIVLLSISMLVVVGIVLSLLLNYKSFMEKLTQTRDLILIMYLCVFTIVVRIILLCIVDVAAWHVDIRYVTPIFPIFMLLLALLTGVALLGNSKRATKCGQL